MFTKRCYGIIVLKSENSNWNADFTKYPRRLPDENATIFATDKSAKYAIRKFFVDLGERVFVWRTFKENGQPKSLEETDQYWQEILKDEIKKITIKEKNNKKIIDRYDFFNKFIDVKLFGITFAVGESQMSITGPLQISYGVNRYNVNVPFVVDIASPFRNKEKDKQTTLGNEIKNLKSYYVYDFVLNPRNLPEGMELTDEDITKLKDALKKFATNLNTTSKIGTENALLLFITLKENSKLVLPTMKNLVKVTKDEVIDLSEVSNLLEKYKKEIETIEVYNNDSICKVEGIKDDWKKGDILLWGGLHMKAFSFELKGDMGFFKKNDTNSIVYTTYNFIHKLAVFGIFGAILGFEGYKRDKKSSFMEYYEKFKNFKVAIIPLYKKPPKKTLVIYNNSTGLASKEAGGVLQVKEQVIVENLGYKIFVPFLASFNENEKQLYEKLEYMIKNKYAEYPIYFGKNEFLAYFENYNSLEIKKLEFEESHVNSLVKMEDVEFFKEESIDEYELFEDDIAQKNTSIIEELPYDFDENHIYKKDIFIFTDKKLKIKRKENFWRTNNEVIYIF